MARTSSPFEPRLKPVKGGAVDVVVGASVVDVVVGASVVEVVEELDDVVVPSAEADSTSAREQPLAIKARNTAEQAILRGSEARTN